MRSWPDGHHIAKNMFAIAFCIVLALPLAYGQNPYGPKIRLLPYAAHSG